MNNLGKEDEMEFHDRSPCGYLTLSDAGKEVTLSGWVDALRDHGEVLFIHLRDRSGIVQVVFTPESTPQTICARAGLLKNEFCILLTSMAEWRLIPLKLLLYFYQILNYLRLSSKQERELVGSLFCCVQQFYLFSLLLNFSRIFGTTTL